jgi:molecular chaperone DnaK
MGKIIGIDLGTTNSAMAVLEGGTPSIIINSDGQRTTPSVVAWKDGDRIVGRAAINQQVSNPDNTIYSVKRFIGRTYSDLTPQDLEGLHYNISAGEKGRPVVHADGRDILPEEVSAAVLSKMKEDAEKFLGEPVTEAIITVPAYFDDNQRQATKDAGKIAGLDVLRIINEPTAAALAYGYSGGSETKKILVFDLGGGTFDVSILDVDDTVIQVISTAGDNHLGGDIWDSTFCEWLCNRFQQENGVDPRADTMVHSRVLEAARKAKEDLSSAESVNVNLPFLCVSGATPLHMDYEITRQQFEEITHELLERCRKPVEDALRGTDENPIGLTMADIDDVLLVGGSTRMPAVQALAKELSGKEPNATVNPDEVVAMGAAVQGGIMNNECQGIVLADVCSMGIGIKLADGSVSNMIPANTTIPTSASDRFSTYTDNQTSCEIVIVQGDQKRYDDPKNKILGQTALSGIPPMPAGQPQLEITFEYDVDGIIHIHAVELTSGVKLDTTIEGTTKLSDNEVKMLAAAEAAH